GARGGWQGSGAVGVIATGAMPATLADTRSTPIVGPRVRVVRAIPLASVVAASGLMLPSPDVSRQVTTAPENGRPSVPVSATCRGMGNGTPTGPAWWSPALTTRADGISGEGPGSPHAPVATAAASTRSGQVRWIRYAEQE